MNNVPMKWGRGGRHAVEIKNPGRKASRIPLAGVVGVKFVNPKTHAVSRLKVGKKVELPGAVYRVSLSGSLVLLYKDVWAKQRVRAAKRAP